MHTIENKAKTYSYESLFEKIGYGLFVVLGIPFGLSIMIWVPFAILFLVLEKTRLNFFMTPMMKGVFVGVGLSYFVIIYIYTTSSQMFSPAFLSMALMEWLRGELIIQYLLGML